MSTQDHYRMQKPDSWKLSELADKLLKEAGCDIWGEKDTEDRSQQSRFEYRMQTGAYSRSSEKKRK